MNEALSRRERAEAKSLIKQANVFNRNMDKVEKFAFKNTRDLSKVERSLGGMIADLKSGFSMDSRFVNRQIEKIVGNDRFSNFKELADEAYEKMVSAEAAFEEHVRQLKDNDPDAQETLDVFLNGLESANRSYGEFLRMAVVALKDTLNEAVNEDHNKGKKLLKGQKGLQEKEIKGLRKKAEKTGMPYSVLKQVYNRGMAAWKTGHRPGTTPQQWAFARVNSFTTKSSGTWGGADKDLAAKVRGSKKK